MTAADVSGNQPNSGANTATSAEATTHRFEAEVHQVLRLVIESLYTKREVFLRELISNASDALDKRRFRAVQDAALLPSDVTLAVRIQPDQSAGTLTISDNGIGMSREELVENLGTIARSGSKAFIEELRKAQQESKQAAPQLIGQFGVGFYSAFLVAESVEVTSLPAGGREAHTWRSDAKDSYTITPARRAEPGTDIVLHLKDDAKEFLAEFRLRELVTRYSDYLAHPIDLVKTGEEGKTETETLNQGKALWQRPPAELDAAQYAEFYKHLGHDFSDPLTYKHFRMEGMQEFVGLLFVPKQPPFDLFSPEGEHGVRLHVKRVLIMEQCKELVPSYLRFIKGLIDSEDLPLNVSRETLQDSSAVRVIRKQVVKRSFDMLSELAKDKPEDYLSFWQNFGPVLKEGLHVEPGERERFLPLLRFRSSKTVKEGEDTWVSLADYKARMPEGQKVIYYMLGDSWKHVDESPHLEMLKKKGFEVLYLTDPVDSWAVSGLGEYEGLSFVSAGDAALDLEEDGTDKENEVKTDADFDTLAARIRVALQDKVSEVKPSKRLASSPVCLVVPEGGLPPMAERLLRAASRDVPATKRVLEVNPDHPIIASLKTMASADTPSPDLEEWIGVLYDQALLAEGAPLDNPSLFAKKVTKLLERAVTG